ncbi:tail fiber domain-containing protein [Xanthomarina sp. F2636L]|uniref:tail fiber domain-containing protein n=1 Tax=Xanthomarina sp. F2636L TaxID=2996018 RepID=UPI00225E30AA|nr:tail fiber domain-containing protein [Xanthomarina sp. F2636L]MCX7550478.1 tail fiber domain-containing protein [Xanthomarina sp. F2636L]
MKKLVFTLVFLITGITFAQQGINYKALIKDGSGNVVANDLISIEFTILQGAAQTNVYHESHAPTTDANGIVMLNIGEGTPISGTFNAIDWATDDHYLNVQINTGTGLTNMGTTQFMSVPYAKQAETATTAANVNGLEAINEGNGTGYRLVGRNPIYFGDIGLDAVDVSASNTTSDSGATGDYAFASGRQVLASGNYAMANNYGNTASGDLATAFGFTTSAGAYASLALGRRNVGGGNPTAWVQTDPLLEVGNGFGANTSNALTILKNGTVTAPSFDITEITDPKALITKEYLENTAVVATGLEAIDEGNGIGWRLIGQDPDNYDNIGFGAVDLSRSASINIAGASGLGAFAVGYAVDATGEYAVGMGINVEASGLRSVAMGNVTTASGMSSTAMGTSTEASGDYSTAMGRSTTASGYNSTAMGYDTTASGEFSTAMGYYTTASSYNSTAMGYNTIASSSGSTAMGNSTVASGVVSTAMGYYSKAEALMSTALGRYNIGGGDPVAWVQTEPLFEIGNGGSTFSRSNALTVLKNGNLGITTNTPETKLQVTGGSDAGLNQAGGFVLLGETSGMNLVMDTNEIMVRNNGVAAPLHLQNDGGQVAVGGAIVHSSDRRLKRDIEALPYGLNEILQLAPKQYYWKNRGEQTHKSLGLIAQEVQPIISELVHTANDENQTLSVNYTELIPVLINAIQEQQKIIDSQKKENLTQKTELSALETNYKTLLSRIEALETKNNNSNVIASKAKPSVN